MVSSVTVQIMPLPESTLEARLTCGGPELKLIISTATAIIVKPTLPPGF